MYVHVHREIERNEDMKKCVYMYQQAELIDDETISCRTTVCQVSKVTLHPRPYTYTSHPIAYTLHPTLYTMHYTLFTIYPKSCTLNPQVLIDDEAISCRTPECAVSKVYNQARQTSCIVFREPASNARAPALESPYR